MKLGNDSIEVAIFAVFYYMVLFSKLDKIDQKRATNTHYAYFNN